VNYGSLSASGPLCGRFLNLGALRVPSTKVLEFVGFAPELRGSFAISAAATLLNSLGTLTFAADGWSSTPTSRIQVNGGTLRFERAGVIDLGWWTTQDDNGVSVVAAVPNVVVRIWIAISLWRDFCGGHCGRGGGSYTGALR
jgi:hypothetical protein